MIWIYDLNNLSYLTTPSWADCYCELITEPNDVLLQAVFNSPFGGGTYNLGIALLSPDGQTVLEDVTSRFEWYVYQVGDLFYCNLRLLRITDIMCANKCFIFHVVIKNYIGTPPTIAIRTAFDAYTERYCVDNCCLLPSNIDITQNYPSP